MDYMTFLRNGAHGGPSHGHFSGQPLHASSQNHMGYSFPYGGELYAMAQYQPQRAMSGSGGLPPSKQPDAKPRLSKDEVDLLEREFQKNQKPSSGRKREIAELLKVEHARINASPVPSLRLTGQRLTVLQNWFQNRRAKEKQIKRTREYEARQAAERSASDSVVDNQEKDGQMTEYYGSSNHSQELKASSAAFPGSANLGQPLQLFSPEQDDGLPRDSVVGDGSLSPSDEDEDAFAAEEYASPTMMPFAAEPSELSFPALVTGFLPQQAGAVVETHMPSPDGSIHDHHAGHPENTLDTFAPFTGTAADNIIAPVPTFPSQLLAGDALSIHLDIKSEQPSEHSHELTSGETSHMQTPPDSKDLRFKSPPPPSNIASRRNKGVPAQLNSNALRSYSYGPKTGVEMCKRADAPSPMRRVASATGFLPSRIQKSSFGAAPRSPMYLERTKDALVRSLQGARSPMLASLNTALSPVANSDCSLPLPQDAREATVSSSASDDEQGYTYGPSHGAFFRFDATLKTPPSTPGLGRGFPEQIVSMESAWNYPTSDEPLITPGLGSFGSEEFSMAPAAPGYIIQSQPPTPSFAPGIGPSYFPWSLSGAAPGNAEYTFPGESYLTADVSAKSSPGQPKSRQFQFQNVTPQDFSAEK